MGVFTSLPLLLAMLAAGAEPGSLVLSGRVLEADGDPAAGAEVMVATLGATSQVVARGKTDAEGTFRLDVPADPDPDRANFPVVVWGYRPGAGVGGLAVARRTPPAEGKTIVKLERGRPFEVLVRGPDGAAVAGAVVEPGILRVEGGRSTGTAFTPPDELTAHLSGRTDAAGIARLKDIDPVVVQTLVVESARFGRQGGIYATDASGLMTVPLAPVGRVVGRVKAADPAAAVGLTVIVRTRPDQPGPGRSMGHAQVVTDASGRFEVPAIAAGRLTVNVLVPKTSGFSPRFPAARTLEPGGAVEVEIAMEGPARLRTVAGRVVDRRGQPVAKAVVFQSGNAPARTRAGTDAEGKFRLDGVAEGPTFVFARAEGFRFTGRPVGAKDDDVALTLTRDDEPADSPSATLPPALSRAEELALARRVLEPYAVRALKDGGESDRIPTLEAMARTEPERVLELIEKGTIHPPFLVSMLRMRVATGLREDAPDEALAVIDAIEDPATRAMGLVEASDALAPAEGARKREILARAAVDARGSKDPNFRILMTSLVAERWLDLGETERGTALLRESQKDAEKLPTAAFGGYARGVFAEELSQIDLPAALALIKDLTDAREFDRHHGNIAHELAGRDPDQAERVLAMVRDVFQRDQYAVRVAYRMPRVDAARARRVAGAIHDASLRGYGLGMVALALAESGRRDDAALRLAEALDVLDRAAEAGGVGKATLLHPAAVAAALIPVAERADPKLVAPTFWRALSLRAPKIHMPASRDATMYCDLQVAVGLARYDRAVARNLIESYVRPDAPPNARLGYRGLADAAAAAIDPRWAVELIESLPDDPDGKAQSPKNRGRIEAAHVLARRGEARWRYLTLRHVNLWVPDVEDIAPNL